MASCANLAADQFYDCENRDTGGLEQVEIILMNRSDIDFATTIVNRDATTGIHNISSLNLLAGTKAYSYQGIPGKSILSSSYTKNTGDFIDTVTHVVNVAFYNQCEQNLASIQNLVNGAEIVAIVEQRGKGLDNLCSYQIYGFDKGLKAGDVTYNSNENNGIVLFPLTSLEPSLEPYVPYNYMEGDYATTVTKIETLKAGV